MLGRAPGDRSADRIRQILRPTVSFVGLLVTFGLLAAACGPSATSAVDDEGQSASDPATGSNEDLQGTDASEVASGEDQEPDDEVDPVISFDPAPEGYLVWAHPIEPLGLAVTDQVDGGLYTTSWIREGLLEGLYRVDRELTYQPELLASDASVTANDNGTVTIAYRLRPGLTWSDGEPLTAADVEYTHTILMEGCLTEADGSAIDVSNEGCVFPLADRTGYDLVTSFNVADDLNFSVNMAAFYPDWRSLYPQIFAAHAFGVDATAVVASLDAMVAGRAPLPSSGPLVFESWVNRTLRLTVNEQYHGGVGGSPGSDSANTDDNGDGEDAARAEDDVDAEDGTAEPSPIRGVQINFVQSPAAALAAIADRSADIGLFGATPDLVNGGPAGVRVRAMPALEFDHLGLNLLNEHLADPLVRQAVLAAIGRQDVVAAYGPLVGAGVTADGVGNSYWLPGQTGYQDHQPEALAGDPDTAAQRLAEAGYAAGPDGVVRHPTRGRLSLRLTTNSGDPLRVALQETLVEQLMAAGFEIEAANRGGGAYLTEGPFAPDALAAAHSAGADGDPNRWDMALFAWAAGPWPGLQSGAFRANSPANPYGFASPEFDAESSRCDGLADDEERTTCYQGLDTFATTLELGDDGLFVIPLVERPRLVVSNDRLASIPDIVDGPSGGPLPDVGGYALASEE